MSEKNRIISSILVCVAVGTIGLFIIFLTALLSSPFYLAWLIATIICSMLSILTIFFAYLFSKEYRLKYFFLGKEFKKQLNTTLNKLNFKDEKILKQFIKERKSIYRKTGSIFFDDMVESLFKNNKHVEKVVKLYISLLNCIKSKGGFVEFCKTNTFEDFESSWEAKYFMCNNLISPELRYLISEVLILTDFSINDNGLSEEFTKTNNVLIEKLNTIYSPSLFNFEQELDEVVQKLQNVLKNK